MSRPNSLALRMAWREARASGGKFLFVILAVAAGVGALTGVRGFSQAFHEALLREARTLMAADLSVQSFITPTAAQQQVLDRLAGRGVLITPVTETLSMMSSAAAPQPLLVSIKAVDPRFYPFYGQVRLEPAAPLAEALTASSVVVSEDLLLRLETRAGENVRIGSAEFRVAGVVRQEPDRMTGSLNVGPRLMISREGLDRTGLMKFGSRASQRFLLKLAPGGPGVAEVRRELESVFRYGSRIADFRQTHPLITQGLNRATTFLSLASLIALIVGGLGVATAIQSHLQQKMDSIGILKCLGARSGQVIRIYLAQALGLGVAGSLAGILLGYAVQAAFPRFIAPYFALPVSIRWTPWAALEGLGIGVLTTLLFTLPPLLGIRQIKPADVFRREMPEARPPWRERLRRNRTSIAAGAGILAGIGAIAAWLAASLRLGAIFVIGVAASLLVLSAVAWLLLRFLRVLPGLLPRRLPTALRHGIANLHRPGSHAGAVLVALGMGVTFTLTVYLVQRSLVAEIMQSAPPDTPNVFLINITDKEQNGIAELLHSQHGVEDARPPVPVISGRLLSVNGTPPERLPLEGWQRRFQGERPVTWSESLPRHMEVVRGAWWKDRPASVEVSVAEEAAETLAIHPGASLEWQFGTRKLVARVAAIHRSTTARFGGNLEFIFSPGALDGLPAVYYASARVRPRDVAALQKAAFERYPTVTVINAADVLQTIQQVVDHAAVVVRFISGFTIAGGVIILAAGVAGTRFRRIREVVILKTLGATRYRVARIFSVEFLILGAVAGLVGSLLSTVLSGVILRRIMEAELRVYWPANLAAVLATALIANFAGWVASFRILGQKPLEILRHE
ncbi:MAG: FtsX-like permease family protein [Acidobacteria bacterium]|nr:FtsX-like permease family protein [Acidobacteriota bacterium]